jgi:hypothetical protein
MKYKHQERWPTLACNQTGRSLRQAETAKFGGQNADDLKAKKFPDVEFQQRELQERNKGRATKDKAKREWPIGFDSVFRHAQRNEPLSTAGQVPRVLLTGKVCFCFGRRLIRLTHILLLSTSWAYSQLSNTTAPCSW